MNTNSYITAPIGFNAGGAHVGLKKQKKDLTLISTDVPAVAAGCFTQNIVKAAPVLYDQMVIDSGKPVRGIVINSGNANACTGQQGMEDTADMAARYGALLNAPADEILVCSTGVIGVPLPMETVRKGIDAVFPLMGGTEAHGDAALEGIMTTDTVKKSAAERLTLGGRTVTIAGIAKGSGMIHPNMATLLAFITTDAAIPKGLLQQALSESVKDTYNMISVDGDTSTNDSILALANGMAENKPIENGSADYEAFLGALNRVNRKLAIAIAADGEGATKLVEVSVSGARSDGDARKLAKAVVSSSLFKAALFGADANWGRIMCAMGYGGGAFDPQKTSIAFHSDNGSLNVLAAGNPLPFDEALAKNVLGASRVTVGIELGEGAFSATAWGCDLTYDYVKINGDYRS